MLHVILLVLRNKSCIYTVPKIEKRIIMLVIYFLSFTLITRKKNIFVTVFRQCSKLHFISSFVVILVTFFWGLNICLNHVIFYWFFIYILVLVLTVFSVRFRWQIVAVWCRKWPVPLPLRLQRLQQLLRMHQDRCILYNLNCLTYSHLLHMKLSDTYSG